MAISVREPDVDAFIELSAQLTTNDPDWIPPIRARLQQELTGADAFGRYGRLRLVGCETSQRFDVVPVDPSDAPTVLRRLHALLDAMWTGHGGYTSLEFAEFVEVFAPALSLMTRGDLHVAIDRASGRDVGCIFSYPDYAADVRALNGDATSWGRWRDGGARPRRLVMHTIGIAPDVRRTGVVSALLRAAFEHCVEEYEEGVMALVVEELAALKKLGGSARQYALFGPSID